MNLNDANLFSGVLGENQIKVNEPMSRHTTFGIGGPADFFLLPETTEELCIITKLVRKNNLPLFILGGGANLLVRDKGIRGVVICTSRLQGIEEIGNMLSDSRCCQEGSFIRPLRDGICKRHPGFYRRSCIHECGCLWRGNVKNHFPGDGLRYERRPCCL